MMTSQQSGSSIGGEVNSQTTHGSIVVECQLKDPNEMDPCIFIECRENVMIISQELNLITVGEYTSGVYLIGDRKSWIII